jgi:putative transcriptional regulator
MTQKELAKHVGVSRQTIMAIEASKYPPSLEIAFRIAHCFAVSVEDVFLYQEDYEDQDKIKAGLIIEVEMGGDDDDGEK